MNLLYTVSYYIAEKELHLHYTSIESNIDSVLFTNIKIKIGDYMEILSETLENGWIEYTLINNHGMQVKVLNYGGIITEILVPDKDGHLENVVLSYENKLDYAHDPYFLGATIGRVAGKIANSNFIMHGETVALPANENEHHMHGGENGFHKLLWNGTMTDTGFSVNVHLNQKRHAGEDGYPGDLDLYITYALTNDNQLRILYEGMSNTDTILSLTNQTYFNLSGNGKRPIHNHEVTMHSSQIVELNEELLPTGNLMDVSHTPFDFRNGQNLSKGIESDHSQNKLVSNGYHHYFVFDNKMPMKISEQESGRTLTIMTNQPGMVMSTANTFPESTQFSIEKQGPYSGVTFATQATSASLQYLEFPTVYLKAHTPYKKLTAFTFGIDN